MQTQTHIYKDLDTVTKHTKKMGFPKACSQSDSKINANSSCSNLFLLSVPNVLNLLKNLLNVLSHCSQSTKHRLEGRLTLES